MNTLTMTGNLTRDPELTHVGERALCKLRLAVDNGRHPTTYIDVRTFDEHAYACAEYLYKGRKVGVSGRLALDEWRNAEDERRHRYSVIGRVEFLDRPKAEGGGGDRQPEPEPSDHNAETGAQPELALVA
jgi:single-strand DNA-binding protein